MTRATAIVLIAASLLVACGGGSSSVGNPPTPSDSYAFTYRRVLVDYRGPWHTSVEQGQRGMIGSSLDVSQSCPWYSEWQYTACVDRISLDGSPAEAADLRDGHIVELHGAVLMRDGPWDGTSPLPTFTSAESGHIVLDIQRAIVGPVESIDPQHLRIEVSGQSVYVDDTTILAVPNFDDSLVGASVTVSGFVAPGGRILATRIEPYAGSGPYLLRGILSDLGPNRFAIGNLEVDIAGAAREGFPGGAPVSGDPVLVLADQPPANGVLAATMLRNTAQDWVWSPGSDPWGGIRGFVTAVRSVTDIDLEGFRLAPDVFQLNGSATPTVGSFAFAEVRQGRVEVVAGRSTNSELVIAGAIDAIDPVLPEFSIFGIPIGLTPATQIFALDDLTAESSPLALDDLSPGDAVTVQGGLRWSVDRWVAGSVARSAEVQSRIDAGWDYFIDDSGLYPVIVIAGQSIRTNEFTSATVCGSETSLLYVASLQDDRGLEIIIAPDTAPPLATALHFGCVF